MMLILYFIVFAMFALNKVVNSQKSIYAVTNGSLTESLTLNFSVIVKEFNGAILYIIDSHGNSIGISVFKGDNNEHFVRVLLDKSDKSILLRKLCGCEPCNDKLLRFYVQLNGIILEVTCNKGFGKTLLLSNGYNSVAGNVHHRILPIPALIAHKNDSIFLIMGNTGPYMAKNRKLAFPSKEQLIGCLINFFINKTRIYFQNSSVSTESGMLPLCLDTDSNNICNGGVITKTINGVVCDCRNTTFNGLYCNKSLVEYKKEHISYIVAEDSTNTYLKLTWKQWFSKKYCLIELINGNKSFVLSTNNNQLIFNYIVIGHFDLNVTNVVRIVIANNILLIKIINTSKIFDFSVNRNTIINVGFSNRIRSYQIFEGEYDVHVDSKRSKVQTLASNKLHPKIIDKHYAILAKKSISSNQYHAPNDLWKYIGYILSVLLFVVVTFVIYNQIKRISKVRPVHIQEQNELSENPITIQEDTEQSYYSAMDYEKIYSSLSDDVSDGYMEPISSTGDE